MNVTLSANPIGDIASSTTSAIGSFAGPALVICALLLAFLVIEFAIYQLTPHSTPTHSPESGG